MPTGNGGINSGLQRTVLTERWPFILFNLSLLYYFIGEVISSYDGAEKVWYNVSSQ